MIMPRPLTQIEKETGIDPTQMTPSLTLDEMSRPHAFQQRRVTCNHDYHDPQQHILDWVCQCGASRFNPRIHPDEQH